MRLLILTHRRDDPSFRVRWEQHLPVLARHGIETEVREVGKRGRRALFNEARGADTVVLHRRLLALRDFRALRRRARRLVYDFDDALCYRPVAPHRSRSRERRFFRTVARADLVLAGNRFLAGLARLRASRVLVLPSTVPEDPPPEVEVLPGFTAVWIGQSVTLPHLDPVRKAVASVGVRLRVIADQAPADAELIPWSLDTEKAELARCHVGLMPLPSDPFARGKCGYKLLQYYAAGLPAIASPVGVNRLLAEGGAILARTADEWADALRLLRSDPDLRQRLGRKGRAFVLRRYAAGPLAERLARLLLSKDVAP